MLILVGSGAPELTAAERHDDVLVATLRKSHTWRALIGSAEPTLHEITAERAVCASLPGASTASSTSSSTMTAPRQAPTTRPTGHE